MNTADVRRLARGVLRACAAQAGERIALLIDDDSDGGLVAAFGAEVAGLGDGAEAVTIALRPRRPAFADLPPLAVEALLAARLAIDLTTVPWLYSDSFTRYGRECAALGSRLALVWGNSDALPTLLACPPSPRLARRARAGLAALQAARVLRVRSPLGTDVTAELGEPTDYPRAFIGEPPTAPGMIGAPLCASVTAPFVPGTARGTLAFGGAGRFQGPENRPIRATSPVWLTLDAGRVTDVAGDGAAAIALADWFESAGHDDVFRVMDCNFGFDPRGELATADNTVVHSFAGGVMFGIGDPYEYRAGGSRRAGYHLDLMLPACAVELDGQLLTQAEVIESAAVKRSE
jgi:hypothetical protein